MSICKYYLHSKKEGNRMHRPEAAARLLLLAVPLALAACGSVPLTRSLDLVEVTPVAAPKVVAVDIVPQEILQA